MINSKYEVNMHIEKELNYRYITGDCRELLRKVLLALSDPVGLHGEFECFPELPWSDKKERVLA